MPRLCPHCHKLGISFWKTMWSAVAPVECSQCGAILVRKQEWSRYVLLVLVPIFLAAAAFHVKPEVTLLIAIPLFMVGTYLFYRFAHFVPMTPPEKTKCTSTSGS